MKMSNGFCVFAFRVFFLRGVVSVNVTALYLLCVYVLHRHKFSKRFFLVAAFLCIQKSKMNSYAGLYTVSSFERFLRRCCLGALLRKQRKKGRWKKLPHIVVTVEQIHNKITTSTTNSRAQCTCEKKVSTFFGVLNLSKLYKLKWAEVCLCMHAFFWRTDIDYFSPFFNWGYKLKLTGECTREIDKRHIIMGDARKYSSFSRATKNNISRLLLLCCCFYEDLVDSNLPYRTIKTLLTRQTKEKINFEQIL